MTTVSVGFQILHGPDQKLLTVNPTIIETDTIETADLDNFGESTDTLSPTAK